MEIGIVGLPNVGKSSLFNALTKAGAAASNFPFTTIEPNVGVVSVPDERLEFLTKTFASPKTSPRRTKFLAIPGLVKGASQGEGLGNKFLSHIRSVDAIVEVVRVFDDKNVIHVHGGVDPDNDISTINTELLLADLDLATKALERANKERSKDPYVLKHIRGLGKAIEFFNNDIPLRTKLELAVELEEYGFLTAKPLLYVANVSEGSADISAIKAHAEAEGAGVISINVKAENEIVELPESDQAEYRSELGLKSGLDEVIKAGYELLGLITYLTAGPDESRAWTITKGAKAPQAAGKIHTDFEKGFIRAQVYAFEDLKKYGSEKAIRDAGRLRSEGKDYTVVDGDVIEFLFNV